MIARCFWSNSRPMAAPAGLKSLLPKVPFYNSESIDIAWRVIQQFSRTRASSANRFQSLLKLVAIARVFEAMKCPRAGIENALWDIESQQRGIPLSQLLGWKRCERNFVWRLAQLAGCSRRLLEKVATEVAAGYQRIKIKIKPGRDLGYISAHTQTVYGHIDFPSMLTPAYTLDDLDLCEVLMTSSC